MLLTEIGSCDGIPCDPNAVCELRYGQAECVCLPGFIGDGLICTRATGKFSSLIHKPLW